VAKRKPGLTAGLPRKSIYFLCLIKQYAIKVFEGSRRKSKVRFKLRPLYSGWKSLRYHWPEAVWKRGRRDKTPCPPPGMELSAIVLVVAENRILICITQNL